MIFQGITFIKEITKIDAMGGAVRAIENGYMQSEIAKSAHERQKRIERGEDLMVGVNCFTSEHELEVQTTRLVPHHYDPVKREQAEERQIKALTELKKHRDGTAVSRLLAELKEKAKKDDGLLLVETRYGYRYINMSGLRWLKINRTIYNITT